MKNYLNAINCCLGNNNKNVKIYRLIIKQSFEPKLLDFIKISYSKKSLLLRQNIEFLLKFAFLYSYRNLIDISENDTRSPNFWEIFKSLYQNERQIGKSNNPEERPKRWTNYVQIFKTSHNIRSESNPRKISSYTSNKELTTSESSQKVYNNNKPFQKSIQNFASREPSQKVQLTSTKKQIFVDQLSADLPSTEPFIIKHNNPLGRREINDSRIQKFNNPNNIHVDMSSTPKTIKKYIETKLMKINQIITKGPPNPVFINNDKEAENLPTKYLIVYNLEGKITELGFETYSIFIHPENETSESVERIFFNEIARLSFIPFDLYRGNFVIFAIESKFGIKILIFLEKKYITIIKKVIKRK